MLYPIYIWASLKTRYTPQNCMFYCSTDDNLTFSPFFQTNPNLIYHYLRWFSYYRLYSFTPMIGGWASKLRRSNADHDLVWWPNWEGHLQRIPCLIFVFRWFLNWFGHLPLWSIMFICGFFNWDIIFGDLLAVVFVIVSSFHQKMGNRAGIATCLADQAPQWFWNMLENSPQSGPTKIGFGIVVKCPDSRHDLGCEGFHPNKRDDGPKID